MPIGAPIRVSDMASKGQFQSGAPPSVVAANTKNATIQLRSASNSMEWPKFARITFMAFRLANTGRRSSEAPPPPAAAFGAIRLQTRSAATTAAMPGIAKASRQPMAASSQ